MAGGAQKNKIPYLFQEAVYLHQNGRLREAQQCYQVIIKQDPAHGPALHHLGMVLWSQGDTQKALPFVRKALKGNAKDYSAHNTLGLIQTSLEQYEPAARSFAMSLQLKADYAEACFNFARLRYLQENWNAALELLERLLLLRPDHPMGNLLRVACYANMGRLQDVRQLQEDAFYHMPKNNPFAYVLKARIYMALDDVKGALQSYEQAITLDPDFIMARAGKAIALVENGQTTEAKACFLAVLDCDPYCTQALLSLSELHKFTLDDDIYQRLKKADKGQYTKKQQVALCYAWAKYYKDIGQHQKTFSYWKKGAQIEDARLDYDIRIAEERMAEIKHIVPEGFKPKAKQTTRKTTLPFTPIFIVGMPRSGTSLVEQILASHSQVADGKELRFLSQAIGDPRAYEDVTEEKRQILLEDAADNYCQWLAALNPAAPYITDKMPYNYRYIGFIHSMIPQAKILHMKRHPLDTCISCFGTLFSSGQEWSYNLKKTGQYYKLYYETMVYWRNTLPAGSFLDVCYEDLILNPEEKTKELIRYCGLEWEPSCLEFYKTERSVRTASMQQVRQPLYSSSVERWKHYEAWLSPLKEELAAIV